MALQTEIWVRDIKEKLFPSNTFLGTGIDDAAFVENKVVHLPQAGANPTVVKNRAAGDLPVSPVERGDTESTYNLEEYTSTPTLIRDIDEIETSYAKRQSVLLGHTNTLNQVIADWMAYNWAATNAANIVRTSGDNRAPLLAGATGTRKKLTLEDFRAAKKQMDFQDVPQSDRYVIMPVEMYDDLLGINEVLSAEFNQTGKLPDGVVNRLFGINIFLRSKVVSFTNAATPVLRAPDAAALTTANAGAVFYHSMSVRKALGNIKVYANENEAAYYGSIFSAMVRAGGAKAFADQTGCVSLVEAAGA